MWVFKCCLGKLSKGVDILYPHGYIQAMPYRIEQTEIFKAWHVGLRDIRAKAAIYRRIDRAGAGLLGDIKSVGGGVSEMRVDVGPGYRLYFTIRRRTIVFLLCGGDKRTQDADICRAKELEKEI